jgi:hypothetical protein
MPKKDFTQVAHHVFEQAVGDVPKDAPSPTQEARRKSGEIGGKRRAKVLTPEQRTDIARTASQARWKRPKGG